MRFARRHAVVATCGFLALAADERPGVSVDTVDGQTVAGKPYTVIRVKTEHAPDIESRYVQR